MKKTVAVLLLAIAMGSAQARSAVPLVEPERVAFSSNQAALTPSQVRQAVVRGGARHGWVVADEAPGKLRLKYIKQNKHEVVVDVDYDSTGFLIRYVSSREMKYQRENGVPVIHPFYDRWVRNLGSAIAVEAKGAVDAGGSSAEHIDAMVAS